MAARRRAALGLFQRPEEGASTVLEGISFLLSKGHVGCPLSPDAPLMREAREVKSCERFNPFILGDQIPPKLSTQIKL